MKILHITDTHLVPAGEMLHGLDPLERLRACVDDILAHHTDAQACVITGDLTHRGEALAYEALASQLKRLTMPLFPLMGNHDRREEFWRYFPDGLRDVNGHVQGVHRVGEYSLVMMDTLEEGESGGRYCAQRLQWLEAKLQEEARSAQRVLLFMHHPPFPIGIPCLDRISLDDPEPMAAVLRKFSNVQHLFFGHVHRPVCGQWRGLSYSTLRGLNHQVPFDLHTISPVPKSHEPPAYGVVMLSSDQVVVHFHDYLDQSVQPAR